eukprot:g5537.t1
MARSPFLVNQWGWQTGMLPAHFELRSQPRWKELRCEHHYEALLMNGMRMDYKTEPATQREPLTVEEQREMELQRGAAGRIATLHAAELERNRREWKVDVENCEGASDNLMYDGSHCSHWVPRVTSDTPEPLCIVQYDTRPYPPDKSVDLKNGRHYMRWVFLDNVRERCRADPHCTYLRPTTSAYPPWWAKVFETVTSLERGDCKVAMFLDADANYRSKWAPSRWAAAVKGDVVVATGTDTGVKRSLFNAGFFMIRWTPMGKRIAKEWLSMYHPKLWSRDKDGKWQCLYQKPHKRVGVIAATQKPSRLCEWADVEYEQGAFATATMLKPEYAGRIRVVPASRFNDRKGRCRGDIVHFYGVFKAKCYWRDFVFAPPHAPQPPAHTRSWLNGVG